MRPAIVTIDLVREELLDRIPDDNSIDLDQCFSDEEILHAMDRAAAAYNGLAPLGVGNVDPRCMPATTNIFLDATISRLLGSAIHKLSRNLLTWQAGGVSVDLERTRMEAFKAIKAEIDQEWKMAAKELKMELNRRLAWGAF